MERNRLFALLTLLIQCASIMSVFAIRPTSRFHAINANGPSPQLLRPRYALLGQLQFHLEQTRPCNQQRGVISVFAVFEKSMILISDPLHLFVDIDHRVRVGCVA